jgi:hypothetical protein
MVSCPCRHWAPRLDSDAFEDVKALSHPFLTSRGESGAWLARPSTGDSFMRTSRRFVPALGGVICRPR